MNSELYDLRDGDPLWGPVKGAEFRTLQVHVCSVCRDVTNRMVLRGAKPSTYYSVCPNAAEEWHHMLREKMRLRNPHHPKTYREELEKEITEMLDATVRYRKGDLVGDPDLTQTRSVRVIRIDRYVDRKTGEIRECWYT